MNKQPTIGYALSEKELRELIAEADKYLAGGTGLALRQIPDDAYRIVRSLSGALRRLLPDHGELFTTQLTVVVGCFEDFWAQYPKRHGTNSRKDAKTAWDAALRRGTRPDEIIKGAAIYAANCKRDGILNTKFILRADGFIRSEEYVNQMSLSHAQPNDPRIAAANDRALHGAATMADAFLQTFGRKPQGGAGNR